MNLLGALRQNVLLPLHDVIYPPLCFTCENLRTNRQARICQDCWKGLTRIDGTNPTWLEIRSKFERDKCVQDMVSCFLFEREGKMQQIIHLLKYRAVKLLGVELGIELGNVILEHGATAAADFLVPVPLHKTKLRERGYNQSEYLCEGISGITTLPIKNELIHRKKYTLSQTTLSLDARRENVGDAFAVFQTSFSDIKGKTIIVVDDVITTGSTINACAAVLLDAGARCVLAASAALAE